TTGSTRSSSERRGPALTGRPSKTPRLAGEPLRVQLFARRVSLLEPADAHPAQDLRRLRELDVAVADDLDLVAPRVVEVEPPPGPHCDAGLGQRRADGLLVVDDEAEVPRRVRRLAPRRREGEARVA